jgi:hypothetical protein
VLIACRLRRYTVHSVPKIDPRGQLRDASNGQLNKIIHCWNVASALKHVIVGKQNCEFEANRIMHLTGEQNWRFWASCEAWRDSNL